MMWTVNNERHYADSSSPAVQCNAFTLKWYDDFMFVHYCYFRESVFKEGAKRI